jgi:hypothetical protein
MGNLDFDSTNVEPNAPLDAVPAGKYACRIGHTEIKENSKGTGRYLQLTLDVTDGDYKGRKLFDRLNLWNANSQASEIAQKTLSAICHAVGILKVRNHEELRGKAVLVKVTIRKSDEYGEQNDVKGYEALAGQQPSGYQAAASGAWGGDAEAQPAPASATPPWGQR